MEILPMPSGSDPKMQPQEEPSARTVDFHTDTAQFSGSGESNPDFLLAPLPGSSKPRVLEAGNQIGKYIVRSHLGAGGMGSVYLAFDPLIEREIALKVLSHEQSQSEIATQRFLQEARAIGKLAHPNVVAIYDIDRWESQYFIVMELISGGSLSQRVRQEGSLEWRDACRLIAEAADGLNAAHQASLIHRDVKPENLMITVDGQCKVVDFGLCKAAEMDLGSKDAMTGAHAIMGTPQYMSPEQFQGEELDARADIYSLGGTLFYLLTGKFPFHEAKGLIQMMTSHVQKPVESASRWNACVPVECDRIISKAMAKDPDDRFANAAAMAAALRTLLTRDESSESEDESLQCGVPEPLRDLLLVEPSKMQASILAASLKKAGIPSVRIATSLQEGLQILEGSKPQAVIASLEYNDGTGLDLIRRVRQDQEMSLASVALNSSDSSMEELIEASPRGNSILNPKKSKPDDLVRMIHGTGYHFCEPLTIGNRWMDAQPRLVVLTETGELSEHLSALIRESQVLDVVVDSVTALASLDAFAGPELRLIVRHGTGTPRIFAKLAAQFASKSGLTAVVQEGSHLPRLRAAWFRGITALAQTPLDIVRLRLLFESCIE